MKRLRNIILGLILVTPAVIFSALAQDPEVNYDETKVPPYTLPDPLTMENGQTVTDAAMWRTERRPLAQFAPNPADRRPCCGGGLLDRPPHSLKVEGRAPSVNQSFALARSRAATSESVSRQPIADPFSRA
jgi:hypothetical protein